MNALHSPSPHPLNSLWLISERSESGPITGNTIKSVIANNKLYIYVLNLLLLLCKQKAVENSFKSKKINRL